MQYKSLLETFQLIRGGQCDETVRPLDVGQGSGQQEPRKESREGVALLLEYVEGSVERLDAGKVPLGAAEGAEDEAEGRPRESVLVEEVQLEVVHVPRLALLLLQGVDGEEARVQHRDLGVASSTAKKRRPSIHFQ